jgi:hypothetical protein
MLGRMATKSSEGKNDHPSSTALEQDILAMEQSHVTVIDKENNLHITGRKYWGYFEIRAIQKVSHVGGKFEYFENKLCDIIRHEQSGNLRNRRGIGKFTRLFDSMECAELIETCSQKDLLSEISSLFHR